MATVNQQILHVSMWGCVSDLPRLRQPSRRLLRGSDVHKIIIKSLDGGASTDQEKHSVRQKLTPRGKKLNNLKGILLPLYPIHSPTKFSPQKQSLCYSLLEGDKPGSSMLENAEETFPCLFSKAGGCFKGP